MSRHLPARLRIDALESLVESLPARSAPVADASALNLLRPDPGGTLDEIRLLGQPSLNKYLRYVEESVVDGAAFDRRALVDEWRQANAYYQALEETELGIADEIEVRDLDPALAPLAAEVAADPRYRHAFDTLPTAFAMVELDKLALFQIWVTRQFTDRLQARLGPAPDPATLFRFCQPPAVTEAPVKIRQVGSNRYVFMSESTDFRPHRSILLRPDQVRDHETCGPVSGIAGFVVGFGSNFLTAIRQGEDGRVLLHNGYHRAYALRAQGVTHAPCVVQTVRSRDELQVVASEKVVADPDFYFASARPPLLKDFFDPKIRKVHRVHRTVKIIEVAFEVREYHMGA